MCALQILLTADPNFGRVDYDSLSDQALMEMLYEGLDDETRRRNQDAHGMYLDVCEWSSVKCDEDRRVIEISVNGEVGGTLQLAYLPPKLRALDFYRTKLPGFINFRNLPEAMLSLKISANAFEGSIDLENLPQFMKTLDLNENAFSGSICLTKLPQTMESLGVNNNALVGTLDFEHLPKGMQMLGFNNNAFTGSINLTNLPVSMLFISLFNNQLTGPFVLRNIPPGMMSILAMQNAFDPIAVVEVREYLRIDITDCGVLTVFDENGNVRFPTRMLHF